MYLLRLANDQDIDKMDKWFYESGPLGPVNRFDRMLVKAEFDPKNGAVGFDNIQIYTPQK